MADLLSRLDPQRIPRHVAIIMDGNGRWALKQGENRVFGHRSAVNAVKQAAEACCDAGVEYLTLYTFSTENWSRPSDEINALMELLVDTLKGETPTMNRNGIRLEAVGYTEGLPPACRANLQEAMGATAHNQKLLMTLALNYSGRWEILEASRKLAKEVQAGRLDPAQIDQDRFRAELPTAHLPDPELMIRTSGEQRISNFLLWQVAYSELYITPTLWPDFSKDDLFEALLAYQQRERRFGKTSEQLLSGL